MILYIVRHGDPIYETDSLTERGKLQAEAVGKRLYDAKIDRIFSSPMGRAQETAEPACRLLGLEKNIEEWAHEIGKEMWTPFPDGKMRLASRIQNTYYRRDGNQDIPFDRAYECDGLRQSQLKTAMDYIEENGKIFLEKLGYKEENGIYRILRENNEKVALFCHAGFARAWTSLLLHIPAHIMWAGFRHTHTGITIIEFRNNKDGITAPICLTFSDYSHLYAAGLDMIYDNRLEL